MSDNERENMIEAAKIHFPQNQNEGDFFYTGRIEQLADFGMKIQSAERAKAAALVEAANQLVKRFEPNCEQDARWLRKAKAALTAYRSEAQTLRGEK